MVFGDEAADLCGGLVFAFAGLIVVAEDRCTCLRSSSGELEDSVGDLRKDRPCAETARLEGGALVSGKSS